MIAARRFFALAPITLSTSGGRALAAISLFLIGCSAGGHSKGVPTPQARTVGACQDRNGLDVSCDLPAARVMRIGDLVYFRTTSGWNTNQISACGNESKPKRLTSSGPYTIQVPSSAWFCADSETSWCADLPVGAVKAAVPVLSATDQLIEPYVYYQAYLEPPGPHPDLIDLTFRPAVTGPHRASSKVLSCKQYADRMECLFHSEEVVFDSVVDAAFTIAADVPLEAALAISRKYDAMEVEESKYACLPAGIRRCRPPIKSIRRCGRYFVVDIRNRDCEGSLLVEESGATKLRLVETPTAGGISAESCCGPDPTCDPEKVFP